MARASEISPLSAEAPKMAAQIVLDEATILLPLEGIIDLDVERARLQKEITRLETEIGKVEKKLGNENFVARAKPEVVQENRDRLSSFQEEHAKQKKALARLA